jgi:hypothetical protein
MNRMYRRMNRMNRRVEDTMARLLHDIEDYLEDASHGTHIPGWLRRVMRAAGRTIGGTGDVLARRFSHY